MKQDSEKRVRKTAEAIGPEVTRPLQRGTVPGQRDGGPGQRDGGPGQSPAHTGPLPVAQDRPTDIRTDTAPRRLMPPVTLPPPADATRVPDTAKGTLLVALQLPARVAKTTFQVPS